MEIVGITGSILFSLCAVPQAWECYKRGHSKGLSSGLLWMWFWGEVLTFIYVANTVSLVNPLTLNYVFNFLCLLVILRYKYWERR